MKTCNKEMLYNAISNIDENLVASSINYKPKSKIILKWTAVAACLCVAIGAFGIMRNNNQNDGTNSNLAVNPPSATATSADNADFKLYALPKSLSENSKSKDYEKVMLSTINTTLDKSAGIQKVNYTVAFKSDSYPYDERDKSYSGEIFKQKLFSIDPDSIEFSIEGENITEYSVKAKNNVLSYQCSSNSMGWEKSFENIKVSHNGYIIWRPTCEKFSNEVLSLTGKGEPSYNSNIKDRLEYSNAVRKIYNGIIDFDEYFGDVLTFEMRYKDGTTKSVDINITLDKKGRYMLNYITE